MKKGNKLHNQENYDSQPENGGGHILLLYNDDINDFSYVIESLIEVCNHDNVQAEQCTYLAHYRGQCEIKIGKLKSLRRMRDALVERGIRADIQ